jgi:hypothetical protein
LYDIVRRTARSSVVENIWKRDKARHGIEPQLFAFGDAVCADDGHPRAVARSSEVIPAMLVAVWTGEKKPRTKAATQRWLDCIVDLERVRAMLMRNASLLSEAAKRRYKVPPGFVLSVLTHVAPELDYSVLEGCCAPRCTVECAQYRCSRCMIARYCGEEHMTADWKQHKAHCVPLAQRQPLVVLDCAPCCLDKAEMAKANQIDCVVRPKKSFSGLTLVKLVLMPTKDVRICDSHSLVLVQFQPPQEALEQLERVAVTRCGAGLMAYLDADMSVEGRLVLYMDRAWKCNW